MLRSNLRDALAGHFAAPRVMLVACSLSGCVGANGPIGLRTQRHVYAMPCERIWPHVRAVLEARNYHPDEGLAADGAALATAWRDAEPMVKQPGVRTLVRFVARGTEVSGTGCRVTLWRETFGLAGASSIRDVDLEWELLRRAEPASARTIEVEVSSSFGAIRDRD